MFRTLNAVIILFLFTTHAFGASEYNAYSDYEREANWADQIIPSIIVGDPVWIEQTNGHKFLGIYTEADSPKGAVIVAHGRGWNPDFELYGCCAFCWRMQATARCRFKCRF
jgi:hypothetical protein